MMMTVKFMVVYKLINDDNDRVVYGDANDGDRVVYDNSLLKVMRRMDLRL